jgi:hypothetical protein
MPSYALYPLTHDPVAMFAPVEEKFPRDRLEHRRLVAFHLVPYIDKKHVQTSLRNFAIYFWEYITKNKKILPELSVSTLYSMRQSLQHIIY